MGPALECRWLHPTPLGTEGAIGSPAPIGRPGFPLESAAPVERAYSQSHSHGTCQRALIMQAKVFLHGIYLVPTTTLREDLFTPCFTEKADP